MDVAESLPERASWRPPFLSVLALGIVALFTNPIVVGYMVDSTLDIALLHGSSMEPTASDGDLYIQERLSYQLHDPERGDVVSLYQPDEPETRLMKRVVAVPGDVVAIDRGHLFVNGDEVDEPYLDGRWHGNMIAREMGADEYFVMGDNRDASLDSRRFGPVDRELIISRGIGAAYPLSEASFLSLSLLFARLGAVLVLAGIGCIATIAIARERGRSSLWGIAGFLLGTLGWWLAFTFLEPRKPKPAPLSP